MPPVKEGPHLYSQLSAGHEAVAIRNERKTNKLQLKFYAQTEQTGCVCLTTVCRLCFAILTACCLFITAILTIAFSITELRFQYTFGCIILAASRTKELVIWTCYCCAISFITFICTIMIAITIEIGWYAKCIGAAKLAMVTGREVCVEE